MSIMTIEQMMRASQQATQSANAAAAQAKSGSSNWTLTDWEKYAAIDPKTRAGATQSGIQTISNYKNPLQSGWQAWRGGYLSPEDYSKVQHLEKQGLMDEWQSAYDEAKRTNLERYEDILKGYGERYDNAMTGLQGLGDAEKADLQRAYDISGSQQQQGLVNSGLSSTTIRPAVMQQNTSAMQRAMSLVNERLQGQKLGMQNQLSGEKLGFMERREDEYPDMQYYLELLKQHGAS